MAPNNIDNFRAALLTASWIESRIKGNQTRRTALAMRLTNNAV